MTSPDDTLLSVYNGQIQLDIQIQSRKIKSQIFTNCISGEQISLPLEMFELGFGSRGHARSQTFEVSSSHGTATSAMLTFASAAEFPGLEVEVEFTLLPQKAYLRKQILVRATQPFDYRLLSADLMDWSNVEREWRSMEADLLPYGSHPVYCESLWLGVEFVAAFNEYNNCGVVLRSRPGGCAITGVWTRLHATVAGVSANGGTRQAFLSYLSDIWLSPPRFRSCYNAWWTLPLDAPAGERLRLMRNLGEHLDRDVRSAYDLINFDAGWSARTSILQMKDPATEAEYEELALVSQKAGVGLGLWVSPSQFHSIAFDHEWASRQGYYVLPPMRHPSGLVFQGVSLADPRYRSEMIGRIRELIARFRISHLKLDGFIPIEYSGHHDLLPGEDSVEPLVEHCLELLKAAKDENPGLVIEATFLNSLWSYSSPWLLKYADVIWVNAGGDLPRGIGPAPDVRNAQTNARDLYLSQAFDELWVPPDAVHVFDVIHCDSGTALAEQLAIACGRGRMFLATFINPDLMTPRDWQMLRGFVLWMRRHQRVLQNTNVLPGRIAEGEVYGFSHWNEDCGILFLRNPSNASQNYKLGVAASGCPSSLRDAVCWTGFPVCRGIADKIDAGSQLEFRLAPWETIVAIIERRTDLKQSIPIGAAWVIGSTGQGLLFPDPGIESVRIVAAHGEQTIQVRGDDSPEQQFHLADFTAPSYTDRATRDFHFRLNIQGSSCAHLTEILTIIEFPGRAAGMGNVEFSAKGASLQTRSGSSAAGLGDRICNDVPHWSDARRLESEWVWYIAEAPQSPCCIDINGWTSRTDARIGFWIWETTHVKPIVVDLDLPYPELPQENAHSRRVGLCLRAPTPLAAVRTMHATAPETWLGQQMSSAAEDWSTRVARFYPQCTTMWSDADVHLKKISSAFFPALEAIDFSKYVPPAAHVLDFGSGTGWLSAILSRMDDVCSIDAIDSSYFNVNTMMPQIFAKLEGRIGKLRPIVGLFEPLLAESGAYDLIVASSSIHHANNMFSTLRELRRVLKPNGHLLLLNEGVRGDEEYANHQLAVIYHILRSSIAHISSEFPPSLSSSGILYDATLGDHSYALHHYDQAIRAAGLTYELVDSGHMDNEHNPDVTFTLKHFICRPASSWEPNPARHAMEQVSAATLSRVQQVLNVCGEGIDYQDQIKYYEARIQNTIQYYESQLKSLREFWESHRAP
jgi:SAM-dependent methyltransferase